MTHLCLAASEAHTANMSGRAVTLTNSSPASTDHMG